MNPENYREERQIVPFDHTPNVAFEVSNAYYGIMAKEETGAWMHCENPVEVKA